MTEVYKLIDKNTIEPEKFSYPGEQHTINKRYFLKLENQKTLEVIEIEIKGNKGRGQHRNNQFHQTVTTIGDEIISVTFKNEKLRYFSVGVNNLVELDVV